GVVTLDTRHRESVRSVGAYRHHYLQARYESEKSVETLGVLRALAPATANDRTDRNGHALFTGGGIATLCRMVHDLIHREKGEIDSLVRHDRSHSRQRRPDRYPGQSVFRKRGVKNPLFAEALLQPRG